MAVWFGVAVAIAIGSTQCTPTASAAAAPAKPEKIPAPIELKGSELQTKDGVFLRATYFPSPRAEENGREVVPVILLHGWKGDRTEFLGLAAFLQRAGHAVLVPDLRGHGESIQARTGTGGTIELDAAKLPMAQIENMVHIDMEKCKSFLMQRNNAGELNIEKLCIVGSELGALIALHSAMKDWSWPQYAGLKQGRYVKGLVLISPPWSFKSLDAKEPLAHPAIQRLISVQIFVGKQDAKGMQDAKRILNALERFRPAPPEDEAEDKQDLFFKALDTKLQGAQMLGVRGLDLEKRIAGFIELRLVRKEFPWMETGKRP